MISMQKMQDVAAGYNLKDGGNIALFQYSTKIFRMGAEHQLIDGWAKPSEALPRHLQDCIICRLVNGKARIDQSSYYAGQYLKGFCDLENGERMYPDHEVLYWMPVNLDDICAEIQKQIDEKQAGFL